MPVTLLDPVREAGLRAAGFTYSELGRTATSPPSGYTSFTRTTNLKTREFDAVSAALFSWQVQARSGIRVAASSLRVVPDAVVLMRLGVGPLSVAAPCRVVYVVDEPSRRGFAYGTLPGHPESGEESFELGRTPDGRITLTVRAFSRPASLLARLSGPAARVAQSAMTSRYLSALDRS